MYYFFIYLFNWGLRRTQEYFSYSTSASIAERVGRGIPQPSAGARKTYPPTAGEEAGLSWTWTHNHLIGERLRSHALRSNQLYESPRPASWMTSIFSAEKSTSSQHAWESSLLSVYMNSYLPRPGMIVYHNTDLNDHGDSLQSSYSYVHSHDQITH